MFSDFADIHRSMQRMTPSFSNKSRKRNTNLNRRIGTIYPMQVDRNTLVSHCVRVWHVDINAFIPTYF